MANYIPSSKIKVFPSAKRSQQYDYTSMYNTEDNLTKPSKSVSHIKSYYRKDNLMYESNANTYPLVEWGSNYKQYGFALYCDNGKLYLTCGKLVIDGYTIQIKNTQDLMCKIELCGPDILNFLNDGTYIVSITAKINALPSVTIPEKKSGKNITISLNEIDTNDGHTNYGHTLYVNFTEVENIDIVEGAIVGYIITKNGSVYDVQDISYNGSHFSSEYSQISPSNGWKMLDVYSDDISASGNVATIIGIPVGDYLTTSSDLSLDEFLDNMIVDEGSISDSGWESSGEVDVKDVMFTFSQSHKSEITHVTYPTFFDFSFNINKLTGGSKIDITSALIPERTYLMSAVFPLGVNSFAQNTFYKYFKVNGNIDSQTYLRKWVTPFLPNSNKNVFGALGGDSKLVDLHLIYNDNYQKIQTSSCCLVGNPKPEGLNGTVYTYSAFPNLYRVSIPSSITEIEEDGLMSYSNTVPKIRNNYLVYKGNPNEGTVTTIGESEHYSNSVNRHALSSINLPFLYLPKSLTSIKDFSNRFTTGNNENDIFARRVDSPIQGIRIPGNASLESEYWNLYKVQCLYVPKGVLWGNYGVAYRNSELITLQLGEGATFPYLNRESAFVSSGGVTLNLIIPVRGFTNITHLVLPKTSDFADFRTKTFRSTGTSWTNAISYITEDPLSSGSTVSTKYVPKSLRIVGISSKISYDVTTNYTFANLNQLISIDTSCMKNVPEGAFYNCSGLTTITFKEGSQLISIGKLAFYHCSGLTNITIPSSVQSIGDFAFSGCSNLQTVTFKEGSLLNSIGNNTFTACSSLTSITIPNSVTDIGGGAFNSCSNLQTVTFEENSRLNSIGNSAFIYCSSLTSITIPNSVTSIGGGAGSGVFRGCSGLEEITLPFVGGSKSATSASSSTLFGYIFGTSSYTGGMATEQYYSSSSSVTYYIPTNLTKVTITGGNILYGAFFNCNGLTSITIPSSVTTIADAAFYACSSLTSITIPNSVTRISYSAFSGCSNLQTVTFEENSRLNSIDSYAFGDCSSLTSITIPSSVTYIGSVVFTGCSNLQTVIFEEGSQLNSIGDSVFYGCSGLEEITLPFVGGSKSATSASPSTLFGYIFGTSSYDGGTAIIQYYQGSNYVTYYIPTSLTKVTITGGNILHGAFSNCRNLTSITIPSSVTSIGERAFIFCRGLTSITIPSSVTSIGMDAFRDCSNLTNITIPNSVISIGNSAFHACSSLTSITIPNSVTDIGSYAFNSCDNLTSITIPSSVTSIGYYVFYGCSILTSITFEDITTWYRTTSFENWQNKTGGSYTSVTNSSTNATYFKDTYKYFYWYKI